METSALWEGVITADDEARYAAAGFGQPIGTGRRPALVIIDVQYRTVGTHPLPFFEAIKEFPTSCGEVGWAAVANVQRLLAAFRRSGLPVLYPHVAPKLRTDAGRLGGKIPGIMDIPEAGYHFVEEVAPLEGDILLPKKHPSAFFGTPLVSHLVDLGVDTLIVTGCTTSGCVRASAVDAFAYNFRVVIPHDAVYDRSVTVHKANLFDLAQKYADVVDTSWAVDLVDAMAGAVATVGEEPVAVYVTRWEELPEVEVLPNNYRRAISGVEVGINCIRWEHPSGTPPHVHDDAEKAVIVIEGSMEWEIGDETVQLMPGTVAVVPRGIRHSGRTTGATVRFYEAFTPTRIQNLVGFLGQGLLPPGEA